MTLSKCKENKSHWHIPHPTHLHPQLTLSHLLPGRCPRCRLSQVPLRNGTLHFLEDSLTSCLAVVGTATEISGCPPITTGAPGGLPVTVGQTCARGELCIV